MALLSNTTGFDNTATGFQALVSNTTGDHNMADGYEALLNNTTGFANTASGEEALLNNTIGSFNTALGSSAGDSVTTATHVIAIGTTGANVSHSCYIGSIAGQTVGAGGSTCYVDNDGKLGVFLSARRFKTDIADMAAASDVLLALRPVTFHYKPELDKLGIPQAQDREIQEQKATIAQLKAIVEKQEAMDAQQQGQIEALTMGLQKVSAQVEMSHPAPQTVLNSD